MEFSRQLQISGTRVVALAFTALVAACAQLPVEGEVLQPGVTPAISQEAVGGIASLRVRLQLDSASGAWESTTCPMHLDATACASSGSKAVGTATPAVVAQLYGSAREDAFRALKSSYAPTGQVADGMQHTLTISGEGRTRRIEWGDGANLPAALSQFSAALYQATTATVAR